VQCACGRWAQDLRGAHLLRADRAPALYVGSLAAAVAVDPAAPAAAAAVILLLEGELYAFIV